MNKENEEKALNAAIWVTCSPHEWIWTHDEQVAMARYCVEANEELLVWKWVGMNGYNVEWRNENPVVPWALCVDDCVLGRGRTPEEAIKVYLSNMPMRVI